MKYLSAIITSLSKEEIRFYKLFVGRTKQSKERKDVALFDILKKNSSEDSKKTIEKLNINSNNYYQLKNRIYKDLNNSMIWQHISKDQQSKSFSYVLLARVYKNKGDLQLTLHYLLIAEKEAIELELYEILSIVYSEIIELSHELISIDLKKYTELKIANSKILVEMEEVDILLAELMYDIKTKQNFSKSDPTLIKVLTENYNKSSKSQNSISSPRFRMRLYKTYSRLLLQQQDYDSLEKFLLVTYNDFLKDSIFNFSNHNDKLTLLTYLTNCYHKLKKYSQSLEYAEKLKLAMTEYDGFLSDKYIFYYYNSLVLNYSIEDKEKALEVLKIASQHEAIKKLPAYTSFIYLNTALIYFYQKKYQLASKNISRLIFQEDFLSLDPTFRLKLLINELIIKLELPEPYALQDKIAMIQADYKFLLDDEKLQRDFMVLAIISKLINKEGIDKEVKLFQTTFDCNNSVESDIINYNDWLAKLQQK
jgi:hypothetical protein